MRTGKHQFNMLDYVPIWAIKIIAEVPGFTVERALEVDATFGTLVGSEVARIYARRQAIKDAANMAKAAGLRAMADAALKVVDAFSSKLKNVAGLAENALGDQKVFVANVVATWQQSVINFLDAYSLWPGKDWQWFMQMFKQPFTAPSWTRAIAEAGVMDDMTKANMQEDIKNSWEMFEIEMDALNNIIDQMQLTLATFTSEVSPELGYLSAQYQMDYDLITHNFDCTIKFIQNIGLSTKLTIKKAEKVPQIISNIKILSFMGMDTSDQLAQIKQCTEDIEQFLIASHYVPATNKQQQLQDLLVKSIDDWQDKIRQELLDD